MRCRMKRIIFLPVLVLVCCISFLAPKRVAAQDVPDAAAAAEAETGGGGKPVLTSPFTIAMAYYKLTARAPDFEAWVKQKDAYKNANAFDQPGMIEPMVQKMKEAYNLLQLTDPLLVETQVTLSAYDAKNQGFFVESFKPSTFFPATYAGQSYAIVPQDIMDKQFLKVDDAETAAAVEKAAAGNGRGLTMILQLIPRYADAKSPAVIDDESYWPIAADVKEMMLYPPNSDTMLWHSSDGSTLDKNHQNILNLYQ